VQKQLLDQFPSAHLRVYAVWLPMLWSDSRSWWNGYNMPDPRVTHYWDGGRKIGQWFAEYVDGYEGVAWDSYYLYGPEAVWDTVPSPLASSGGTTFAERQTLESQVRVLLEK
jgi:hypothetical protein